MRWGLVACALAGCGGPSYHRPETLATLTDELPNYAPIPDDTWRAEVGVRAMIGGYTLGGFHAVEGGGALSLGARRDALAVRLEGDATALGANKNAQQDGPLGDGRGGDLLRLAAVARYGVFASAGGSCHWCGKHAPPTELDRLDVWIEGGAGEQWARSAMGAATRTDVQLGAGLEVGPRKPGSHWALELGLRVLFARPVDATRGIDHPLLLVVGGSWGD
jgi:hypothetical protein